MLRFGFIWMWMLLRSWNYCWHNKIIISDTQYHIFNTLQWSKLDVTKYSLDAISCSLLCFLLLSLGLVRTETFNESSWEWQIQYSSRCTLKQVPFDFYFFINGSKFVAVPTASFAKSNSQSKAAHQILRVFGHFTNEIGIHVRYFFSRTACTLKSLCTG